MNTMSVNEKKKLYFETFRSAQRNISQHRNTKASTGGRRARRFQQRTTNADVMSPAPSEGYESRAPDSRATATPRRAPRTGRRRARRFLQQLTTNRSPSRSIFLQPWTECCGLAWSPFFGRSTPSPVVLRELLFYYL